MTLNETQTEIIPVLESARYKAKNQQVMLIMVTGADKPGVSSLLFSILAKQNADMLDVKQVVIYGKLILTILISVARDLEKLQELIEQAMDAMHMETSIEINPIGYKTVSPSHVVLLLGNPVTAKAFSQIATQLATQGINIESINGIADYPVTGLEFSVSASAEKELVFKNTDFWKYLTEIGSAYKCDVALQKAGLSRLNKKLIVFDVDSTLIQGEVIELLAEYAGKKAEVAHITKLAMQGELDFASSLLQRIKLLAGLPATILTEVAQAIKFTPGARTTIKTLNALGLKCGVVSGGFIQVIEPMLAGLNISYMKANRLEVKDGVLTGNLVGEIIDRAAKARCLVEFAENYDIPLAQTVAVGDGANDIDMLSIAGLGVAFNAKPILAKVADARVTYPYLDTILFIMGITRSEIEAMGID